MAKSKPNTIPADSSNQNTKLEEKRKQIVEQILELREKERAKLEQGKTLVKTQVQALISKTKQLKKIVELINEENASIQQQVNNYKDAETSISSLSSMQETLKHKLKETAKIGIDYSQNLGKVQNKNKEGFKAASTQAASALTSISELAALNKEDTSAIAAKNLEIDNSIAAIKSQMVALEAQGSNLNDIEVAILKSLVAQASMISNAKEEAAKFANISKETKDLYTELNEDLEKINKTFKKITTTIEVFFSSGKNMLGMLLIGAGEAADKFGEMGKEIGVGMTQMVGLKTQVGLVGAILGDTAGEAAMDLAKDLGDSHHLTTSMAVDAGLLAANYGLSAKQAAFMSTAFGELSGKSYEAGKNTGEYVKQLAMANGVAPSQVMKDVADNTEFFALYSQDGGKNIGDAAVAAAKLGVGLGTAEKMANHLLDYQSSVQDEMEASVLLGRDLNLGKARELAYNNDIAGAMKEGLKAVGGIAKWNGMTRYEREATAKALGVSAGEMQQMVAHEETLNGMHGVGNQIYSQTAEILQNMGNSLTGKVLKGMGGLVIGAGELNKGLQGMGTSIGGMARGTKQMLKNLFAMLAPTKILSKLKQFGGAIANTKVGSAIGGIAGKAKDYIAEKAGGLKDKLMDKVDFSGKAEEMVAEKKDAVVDSIKDKVNPEKVTEGANEAAKGDDGSAFKTKAENIAAGLKYFASGKVFIGALNLIPVGIGLLGLLPGLPTLFFMGKMNFGSVLLGFENLSLGLSALGTGSALAGAGVLALTSIALIMMLPGLAVLAIMGAMAPLITLGFGAITAGLTSLGAAAPVAAIGVGILLGLASAFAIFGAGVMLIGLGIKLAMDGITSLISVMPLLAENLGPLIGMILPIFGLAAAIMALSLSLMMLGTMGMVALPVLLALGALGAVAGGLFGGGEGGGGSSNDEMISILKSIDSKVGGTPAINMDSKRITTASNDGAARRGDSGGTKY